MRNNSRRDSGRHRRIPAGRKRRGQARFSFLETAHASHFDTLVICIADVHSISVTAQGASSLRHVHNLPAQRHPAISMHIQFVLLTWNPPSPRAGLGGLRKLAALEYSQGTKIFHHP